MYECDPAMEQRSLLTLKQSKPKRKSVAEVVIHRSERAEQMRRHSIPPVTDEEEITFIKKAVIWMVVLAVIPLILFHIITLFTPDVFMIFIAPK